MKLKLNTIKTIFNEKNISVENKDDKYVPKLETGFNSHISNKLCFIGVLTNNLKK